MHLIDFINQYENWKERLSKPPYCLEIKQKDEYFLLHYNMIKSDFSYDEVCEARSCIVTNENGIWVYVCRPFDKFFNYGEPYAAELDWEHSVTTTEKIDGSLITAWKHKGKWHISTSGNVDAADALVSGWNVSFRSLFEKAVLNYSDDIYQWLAKLDKCFHGYDGVTHLFELVGPKNKVVIPYEEEDIYYLGSRDNTFGYYINTIHKIANRPQCVQASNLEEIIDKAEKLDWMHEGFVAFDGVNRVKVKSPAYVIAHHCKNNGYVSDEKLLGIIRLNEIDEFLTYCPEYLDRITALQEDLSDIKIILAHQQFYLNLIREDKKYNTRKEYIEYFKTYTPNWCFNFLCKNLDDITIKVYEYINNLTTKKLLQLIEQYRKGK